MTTANHEHRRLASLCALNILGTPSETRFDRFTLLATAAFSLPIALVSLIDEDRLWFKSRQGLAESQIARSVAFCSYAIESAETFVVNDASLDPRFAENPLVNGAPHIRFYAGHPIKTLEGYAAGTLCIIDTKPRSFSAAEQALLVSLAKMVEDELNRNTLIDARTRAENALHQLNLDLEQRVYERTAALEAKNDELHREIARRAEVEATLRQSEQRVRSIAENLPALIIQVDRDGNFAFLNSRTARYYGSTVEDLLHQPMRSAYNDKDYARIARYVAQAEAGERVTFESEILLEGQPFHYTRRSSRS